MTKMPINLASNNGKLIYYYFVKKSIYMDKPCPIFFVKLGGRISGYSIKTEKKLTGRT